MMRFFGIFHYFIMPLPSLSSVSSIRQSMHPSMMFCLRYLWYALIDFHPIAVSSASCDRDELFQFWGQKVKVEGPCMTRDPLGRGIV